MVESASPLLPPQDLIARHRRTYFFMQMRMLTLGAACIVIVAQIFLLHQVAAMVIAALAFDVCRTLDGFRLHRLATGRWLSEDLRSLIEYFISATPRRWLEYALLALPANALLTYVLHTGEFDTLNNAAVLTMNFAQNAWGAAEQEVSRMRAGLASFAVNFGFSGVLEYLAARWLFAKRKLKIKNRT